MKTWLKENAKAVAGAVTAGLGALQQALDDNSISAQEATMVASAFFVALGVIWGVPNQVSSVKAAAQMVAARARETAEHRRDHTPDETPAP